MPAITYASPYPAGWHDLPATTTPIDAAALQTVDDGVAAATAQANAALAAAGGGQAWQASTAVKAGQLLTHSGITYVVNADMTTPSTFNTTGLTVVGSGGGSSLTVTSVKTAAYTAQAGDIVSVNAAGGTVPITLVSAPADKAQVVIKKIDGTAGAPGNPVTITAGGTDVFNKTAGSTTITLTRPNQSLFAQYQASSGIWIVIATDPGAMTLPALVRVVAAAYAATVTPNADTTDILNVGALTGNITIANPTGTPVDGQSLRLRMSQDATGARTVSFGTAFAFGTDVPSSTIPATASAKWELLFTWNAADSKWRAVAIVRGF